MRGGQERKMASEIYSVAQMISERIYTNKAIQFVETLKESAEQLESIHCEAGKPEYSRWNKAASIPDNDFSNEARYKYT